jgi:hypothetical protein
MRNLLRLAATPEEQQASPQLVQQGVCSGALDGVEEVVSAVDQGVASDERYAAVYRSLYHLLAALEDEEVSASLLCVYLPSQRQVAQEGASSLLKALCCSPPCVLHAPNSHHVPDATLPSNPCPVPIVSLFGRNTAGRETPGQSVGRCC